MEMECQCCGIFHSYKFLCFVFMQAKSWCRASHMLMLARQQTWQTAALSSKAETASKSLFSTEYKDMSVRLPADLLSPEEQMMKDSGWSIDRRCGKN